LRTISIPGSPAHLAFKAAVFADFDATDRYVDIVGENYDAAIRAHSGPLPDLTLAQRALTPAPWLLFAGSAHLDANAAAGVGSAS
jgi:DNA-binding transcriptional LysR family regulator